MAVTLAGILATGWRARAEEPPRYVGAVPLVEPPPAVPPAEDSVALPLPENQTPAAPPKGPAEPPATPPTPPTPPASPGAPANTQVVAPPGATEPAAAPPEEQGKGKKKKGAEKDRDKERDRETDHAPLGKRDKERDRETDHAGFGKLEIRGRVYARAAFDRREAVLLDDMLQPVARTIDSLDLSVQQARLSFNYRAPMKWLTAVAEVEFSGRPDMRDGYVQARDKHFALRAGQFKVPIAAVAQTSPWTLPFVRRGLIHNVLVDRMDYGGRRPGITVAYRNHDMLLHPRLTLGAFQGSVLVIDPTPFERDTDLLNGQKFAGQTLIARAEIEVAGVELGAYYENRIGSPAPFQTYRYWTAGADLHYDHAFSNGGVRMWIDGLTGTSWYEHASKAPDGRDAMFAAARALIAYRFGGMTDVAFYVEPYTHLAGLDPDVQVTSDLLWEAVLGVNVGYWKRARLTLQGEINKGQRNVPTGLFVGPPPDRVGVILQAGVAF